MLKTLLAAILMFGLVSSSVICSEYNMILLSPVVGSSYSNNCVNQGFTTLSLPLGGAYVTILSIFIDDCFFVSGITTSLLLVGGASSTNAPCTLFTTTNYSTLGSSAFCASSYYPICITIPPSPPPSLTVTISTTSITTTTTITPTTTSVSTRTTTTTTTTTISLSSIVSSTTVTDVQFSTTTSTSSLVISFITLTDTTTTQSDISSVFTTRSETNFDIILSTEIFTTVISSTLTITDATTQSVTTDNCPTSTGSTFTPTVTVIVTTLTVTKTTLDLVTTAFTTRTKRTTQTQQVCGGVLTTSNCPISTTPCLIAGSIQTCKLGFGDYFIANRPGAWDQGQCVCKAASGAYAVIQQPESLYELVYSCLGVGALAWFADAIGISNPGCLAIRADQPNLFTHHNNTPFHQFVTETSYNGALITGNSCNQVFPFICSSLK